MMDIVGYAQLSAYARGNGVREPHQEQFKRAIVPVLEFAENGDVLVLAPNGSCIGDFYKADVRSSFRCHMQGEVLCPPDLDMLGRMSYMAMCLQRKGGYGPIVRQMVIAASLSRGKFTDGFLWQVEQEERAAQEARG